MQAKPINKVKKPLSEKGLTAILISVYLVCVLCLSIVLPIVIKPKDFGVYQIPELSLPIEERYALEKIKFDDLGSSLTTLRADTMNVTERGIARPTPEILSDQFSLVYNTSTKKLSTAYGELVETSGDIKTATINFKDYPYPGHGVDGKSSAHYSDATANGSAVNSEIFYKYMLISQGQHLAVEAQNLSKNHQLTQDWLKKHPAADSQYGEVTGTDNAVEKEITLDPIYRALHPTGLYLPAGELVTVKVEGLKPGERIAITLSLQNSLAWRGGASDAEFNAITGGLSKVSAESVDAYFTKADVLFTNGLVDDVTLQGQWGRQNGRLPWLTADFTFTEDGVYSIGTPFGGLMHINMGNCYSKVKTTIRGAVETPHYILGVTTPEYFDQYLRNAPGVMSVLDTENGQLIGPSVYMRNIKTDEVQKLANLWHSFFTVNESFTGGSYNRFNKVMFDVHVPAGAAVALGNYSFACPTGWYARAMDYQGMIKGGQWGILHEVGHNHGSAYGTPWGFGGGQEGEVRNNALTVLGYIMLCDTGTSVINKTFGVEHGAHSHPYTSLQASPAKGSVNDFGELGYFPTLSMYTNIMHSFGAEKFYELMYTYKGNPSYTNNKRADFAYRCSLVYHMNFIKYFNELYGAGINDLMFSEQQITYIKSLPNYEVVTSMYAGGIDGVKTGGDYIVGFGEDILFDLKTNTRSTLDDGTTKGFTILSVSQPEHGTIRYESDGVYRYSFNKEYNGPLDEFSFLVKLSDGVVHRLTVTLRINYNGSKLEIYNNLSSTNIDDVVNEIKDIKTDTLSYNQPKIVAFDAQNGIEARVLDFYFMAPKTGSLQFYTASYGNLRLYTGKNFNSLTEQKTVSGAGWKLATNEDLEVKEGEFYAIRLINATNGKGAGLISYSYDGETTKTEILLDQVYNPLYPHGSYHKDFEGSGAISKDVFEPEFLVSKKDGIKVSTTGTNKTDWRVVSALDDSQIQGGRIDRLKRVELVKDDQGNPTGETNTYYVEVDKWSYIIDGDVSTYVHSKYSGDNMDLVYPPSEEHPHEYVIDTQRRQGFNYFTIYTRTAAIDRSKITKYKLFISDDNLSWKLVSEGDELEYNKNVALLQFPQVVGRYFKLQIMGTTSQAGIIGYSVLAEVDAGITSKTQRLVPTTSKLLFTTKGWKDSNTMAAEQNGFMISEKKNEKMVIRFEGTYLSLYGAVGEGFGSAKIKLDGKYYSTIDFASSEPEPRKLLLAMEDLEDKTHTVEIISQSDRRVMMYMAGMNYTSRLINAPNIYLEKALAISLSVFAVLFVAALVFMLCLLFIPSFRKKMGNNKVINALDAKMEANKQARKEKKEKEKQQKELEMLVNDGKTAKEVKKEKEKAQNSSKTAEKTAKNKEDVKLENTPIKKQPKAKETKTETKSTKSQSQKEAVKTAVEETAKPKDEAKKPKTAAKNSETKKSGSKSTKTAEKDSKSASKKDKK